MLNPPLYQSLKARFGEVRIANEDQKMVVERSHDHVTGKSLETIIDGGENYHVNCPYCSDTRFRLYISYRWNTLLSDGGVYGKHLVHCFNEECNMRDFEDELHAYISQAPKLFLPTAPPERVPMWHEVQWPGTCVPLNTLPNSHPAMVYLRDHPKRPFDPHKLFEEWNLHFCVDAPDDGTDDCLIPGTEIHARLVRNRIMIPIYKNGMMVGWQARAIVDGEKVKYYTMPGFRKSCMLFNGDRARQYDFGVLVEGFFDAARVGPRSVAAFGHKLSHIQRDLLMAYWNQTGMCIMLDPDAMEDMERLTKLLHPYSFKWGSFAVQLPAGYEDPAEMSHEAIWALISNYARVRNIQLTS